MRKTPNSYPALQQVVLRLGGVYADLDTECRKPLSDLIQPRDTLVAGWENEFDVPADAERRHYVRSRQVRVLPSAISGTYIRKAGTGTACRATLLRSEQAGSLRSYQACGCKASEGTALMDHRCCSGCLLGRRGTQRCGRSATTLRATRTRCSATTPTGTPWSERGRASGLTLS